MGLAWTAIAVFAVTAWLVHLLPKLAGRIGLVDEPDSRKQHEGRVPLVGGLAMYGGFFAGMSLLYVTPWIEFPSLVLGGLLLVVVGVLDDLLELRKRVRVPAQFVAALLMSLVGGHVLQDFGGLAFGEVVTLGVLAVPVTIFCTVGVVNAVNMSDGLDGLAGGLTFITFGALAFMAYDAGAAENFGVLVVLMAAILGFLAFNARSPWCRKAKVFMGDAGSMFLGFAIARFLIDASQGADRFIHPVTALWIFAVPLMDTVAVMLRRVQAGQSPFSADRQHLHHVLLASGYSVERTVRVIWLLALVLAGIGVAGQLAGVPEWLMFAGFLGLFAVYVVVLQRLARTVWPRRPLPEPGEAEATETSGGL